MDLEQLIAMPLVPSIRVRISPEDVVLVDQAKFEEHKQDIIDMCLSIPDANDGISWRQLKPLVNNNGTLAKLLIALGELVGVWRMHPNVDLPQLWGNSHAYPMILANSAHAGPKKSRVPKPSAGDLEEGLEVCELCQRQVPPMNSPHHSPVECDDLDCPMAQTVKIPPKKEKVAAKKPAAVDEDHPSDEGPPPGLEAYLRDINS